MRNLRAVRWWISGCSWIKSGNRAVAANNGSYCPNPTLYSQPSEYPQILLPEIGVYAPDFLPCLGVKTSVVFRNSCTNDRFQPRIWTIIESRFSKPAGYGDSSCVEPALIGVKSVIRAIQAGFTRGRWRRHPPELRQTSRCLSDTFWRNNLIGWHKTAPMEEPSCLLIFLPRCES